MASPAAAVATRQTLSVSVSTPCYDVGNKYQQEITPWTRATPNVYPIVRDASQGIRMEDHALVDMSLAPNALFIALSDGHGSTTMARGRELGGHETARFANYTFLSELKALKTLPLLLSSDDKIMTMLFYVFGQVQRACLSEMLKGARKVTVLSDSQVESKYDSPPQQQQQQSEQETKAQFDVRTRELSSSQIDGAHFRDMYNPALREQQREQLWKTVLSEHALGRRVVADKIVVGGLPFYVDKDGEHVAPIDYGCTTTVAMIVGRKVYVGHVGDSDAVLFTRGGNSAAPYTPCRLGDDHGVNNPSEVRRMSKCGAMVKGRYFMADLPLVGTRGLMPSRGIGHAHMQHRGITHMPFLSHATVDRGDILVIASDGLWDAHFPSQLKGAQYVSAVINQAVADQPTISANDLAELLRYHVVQGAAPTSAPVDNLAIVVVRFT